MCCYISKQLQRRGISTSAVPPSGRVSFVSAACFTHTAAAGFTLRSLLSCSPSSVRHFVTRVPASPLSPPVSSHPSPRSSSIAVSVALPSPSSPRVALSGLVMAPAVQDAASVSDAAGPAVGLLQCFKSFMCLNQMRRCKHR